MVLSELRVAAHEVGESTLNGVPKLILLGQGRREENRTQVVGIEPSDQLTSQATVVSTLLMGSTYCDQPIAPGLLGGFDLFSFQGAHMEPSMSWERPVKEFQPKLMA
jgi:hypothetical protein